MHAYSNNNPAPVGLANGKYQIRYNVSQQPPNEDGEVFWEYEYVEVDKLDRSTIIAALINARHTHDAQLGKLALDRSSDEWAEYDAFRQECYNIAEEVLT